MFIEDGRTYEECDRCGMRVEVDDATDARCWGINHYSLFHPEVDNQ